MKKHTIKIVGGLLAIGVIGYVAYKALIPPTLTIRQISLIDGTGTYEWNGTTGSLNPGATLGVAGGFWGWGVRFSTYVPATGYTVEITKNGNTKKTFLVNGSGLF